MTELTSQQIENGNVVLGVGIRLSGPPSLADLDLLLVG